MYEIYEALKNGVNFEANARNWMDANLPNPFDESSEAHQLYFKAHQYCVRWRRGGIDCRSGKKYMYETIRKIIALNLPNPYPKEEPKIITEKKKEKKQMVDSPIEEPVKLIEPAVSTEDYRVVMMAMCKARNENDETSFKQFTIHLMDVATENPFKQDTEEYKMFEEMYVSYHGTPINKRRLFVVAAQLCELINNTPVEKVIPEEPKTVLGVIPEEKKSWFKFLHPWRKDDANDSP